MGGAQAGSTATSGEDAAALMERSVRRSMGAPTDGRGWTRGVRTSLPKEGSLTTDIDSIDFCSMEGELSTHLIHANLVGIFGQSHLPASVPKPSKSYPFISPNVF